MKPIFLYWKKNNFVPNECLLKILISKIKNFSCFENISSDRATVVQEGMVQVHPEVLIPDPPKVVKFGIVFGPNPSYRDCTVRVIRALTYWNHITVSNYYF